MAINIANLSCLQTGLLRGILLGLFGIIHFTVILIQITIARWVFYR